MHAHLCQISTFFNNLNNFRVQEEKRLLLHHPNPIPTLIDMDLHNKKKGLIIKVANIEERNQSPSARYKVAHFTSNEETAKRSSKKLHLLRIREWKNGKKCLICSRIKCTTNVRLILLV